MQPCAVRIRSHCNYVPCEYGHSATMCRVNMVTLQLCAVWTLCVFKTLKSSSVRSHCNYVPCEYGHIQLCAVWIWSHCNYVPCEYGHSATMSRVHMTTLQLSADCTYVWFTCLNCMYYPCSVIIGVCHMNPLPSRHRMQPTNVNSFTIPMCVFYITRLWR